MLDTTGSGTFVTYNDLEYKTPMYLVHFNGETVDYCDHKPGSPDNTLKQYLAGISGAEQRVQPEEGRAGCYQNSSTGMAYP